MFEKTDFFLNFVRILQKNGFATQYKQQQFSKCRHSFNHK